MGVSAGHQLGQLIGDWFQDYFAAPLLTNLTNNLGIYLDHRNKTRPVRGTKVIWTDDFNNDVDLDFVLELDGSDATLGSPVGFIESCWRRGTRHSKDKVRDDTGKLLPLRRTYPTTRFLGIIAGGDLTKPARRYVESNRIGLLYVPKPLVIRAFSDYDFMIDYPDNAPEDQKILLAEGFKARFDPERADAVASRLMQFLGNQPIDDFTSQLTKALSAPVTISFSRNLIGKVTYDDGFSLERVIRSVDELREFESIAQHNRLSQAITIQTFE